MNAFLWILQVVVALFCGIGSGWRFFNYETQAKNLPSLAALSHGTWNLIGAFEISCALGLILPGLLGWKPGITAWVALLLAIEMLLVTGLHVKHFGVSLQATNPAVWSLALAVAAGVVAYGRFAVRPL